MYMCRSTQRALDWQNNKRLFESAIPIVPNNAKIYYNLGQVAALEHKYNESVKYNLIANELRPNNTMTLTNLGNAYRHMGQLEEALKYHKQAVTIE